MAVDADTSHTGVEVALAKKSHNVPAYAYMQFWKMQKNRFRITVALLQLFK